MLITEEDRYVRFMRHFAASLGRLYRAHTGDRPGSAALALLGIGLLACGAGCGNEGGLPQDVPPETAAAHYVGISETDPTGSPDIRSDGLVVAFDMETLTADGRLRDFSGNEHHGALTTSDVVEGVFNGARRFAAVSDRIHLDEHPDFDLDGPHTIAVWVRVDQLGLHQHLFACDDKWALWITPDDQFRLGDTHGGGWSMTEGSVAAGQWTSVVSVLRGTRGDPLTPEIVALYVDGELADAGMHLRSDEARDLGSWNPGDLYPTDACYVGFESHQGNEAHQSMPFVGALDEVLLFSRAWTEDEVRAFSRR